MIYNLIISLPMVICGGWLTFFLIRCFMEKTERRVPIALICFFAAALVLYINHWLFFSGHPSTVGEWSYYVANLCVYPLYYAYLRALTRVKRNWEVPVSFFIHNDTIRDMIPGNVVSPAIYIP